MAAPLPRVLAAISLAACTYGETRAPEPRTPPPDETAPAEASDGGMPSQSPDADGGAAAAEP
jgi:hypothetical protein